MSFCSDDEERKEKLIFVHKMFFLHSKSDSEIAKQHFKDGDSGGTQKATRES